MQNTAPKSACSLGAVYSIQVLSFSDPLPSAFLFLFVSYVFYIFFVSNA